MCMYFSGVGLGWGSQDTLLTHLLLSELMIMCGGRAITDNTQHQHSIISTIKANQQLTLASELNQRKTSAKLNRPFSRDPLTHATLAKLNQFESTK